MFGQATARATSASGNRCINLSADSKVAKIKAVPFTFGQPAQKTNSDNPQPGVHPPLAFTFGSAESAKPGNSNRNAPALKPTAAKPTAETACQTAEASRVVQLQGFSPCLSDLVQLSYKAAPLDLVSSLPSWLECSQQDAVAVVVSLGPHFEAVVMAFAAAGMLDAAASVMDKVSKTSLNI